MESKDGVKEFENPDVAIVEAPELEESIALEIDEGKLIELALEDDAVAKVETSPEFVALDVKLEEMMELSLEEVVKMGAREDVGLSDVV